MANSWCPESRIKKSLAVSSWTMAMFEFSFWPCFVAWIPVDSLQLYPWGLLYISISWCSPEICVWTLGLRFVSSCLLCLLLCHLWLCRQVGMPCCLNIPEKRQTMMHFDCLFYKGRKPHLCPLAEREGRGLGDGIISILFSLWVGSAHCFLGAEKWW